MLEFEKETFCTLLFINKGLLKSQGQMFTCILARKRWYETLYFNSVSQIISIIYMYKSINHAAVCLYIFFYFYRTVSTWFPDQILFNLIFLNKYKYFNGNVVSSTIRSEGYPYHLHIGIQNLTTTFKWNWFGY